MQVDVYLGAAYALNSALGACCAPDVRDANVQWLVALARAAVEYLRGFQETARGSQGPSQVCCAPPPPPAGQNGRGVGRVCPAARRALARWCPPPTGVGGREVLEWPYTIGGAPPGTTPLQTHMTTDLLSHFWYTIFVVQPPPPPPPLPLLILPGGGGGKRHIPPHSAQPRHTKPLGSANAETTPARAPAAAADRTQRPDAAREGTNG